MDDLLPLSKPTGEYKLVDRGSMGKQMLVTYPNGYGASIISGPYSYGGPEGKYELAVMHPGLCYASPVTGDVIGWLSPEDVLGKLSEIAALPRNDECDHGRPSDDFTWGWIGQMKQIGSGE